MKTLEQYKKEAIAAEFQNLAKYVTCLRGSHSHDKKFLSQKLNEQVEDTLDRLQEVTEKHSLAVVWDRYNPESICKFLRCFMKYDIPHANISDTCNLLLALRGLNTIVLKVSPEDIEISPDNKKLIEHTLERAVISYLESSYSVEDYIDDLIWAEEDKIDGQQPTCYDISMWEIQTDGTYQEKYFRSAISITDSGLLKLKKAENAIGINSMVRHVYANLIEQRIMSPIPKEGAGRTAGCCALYDIMAVIGYFDEEIYTKHNMSSSNKRSAEINKSKRDKINCIIFK